MFVDHSSSVISSAGQGKAAWAERGTSRYRQGGMAKAMGTNAAEANDRGEAEMSYSHIGRLHLDYRTDGFDVVGQRSGRIADEDGI